MEQDKYITREELKNTLESLNQIFDYLIISTAITHNIAFTLATESKDLNSIISKLKIMLENDRIDFLSNSQITDKQIAKYKVLFELQINMLQDLQKKI